MDSKKSSISLSLTNLKQNAIKQWYLSLLFTLFRIINCHPIPNSWRIKKDYHLLIDEIMKDRIVLKYAINCSYYYCKDGDSITHKETKPKTKTKLRAFSSDKTPPQFKRNLLINEHVNMSRNKTNKNILASISNKACMTKTII